MNNLKKSIITVLVTYVSLCITSGITIQILISAHADSIYTLLTAVIICTVLSVAGISLGRQEKSVWISYAITVCTAWLIAITVGNIFSLINFSDRLIILSNQISLILGYPGFAFGMCMGEGAIESTELICIAFYILCGIVPSAITVISVKMKG